MTKTMGRSRENVSRSTAIASCSWPVAAPRRRPATVDAAASLLGRRELGQERDERRPPRADGVEHALGTDLGDEGAERGLDRRVGRGDAAQVDALTCEQEHVGRKAGLELVDQPGLADAGFAADDDGERRARANLLEALIEPREVGVAADHGRR